MKRMDEKLSIGKKYDQRSKYILIISLLFCLVISGSVFADKIVNNSSVSDLQWGPDLYISDTSASTDANIVGEIPLGTIPSELINMKFSVGNKGYSTARGYRVHLLLVHPDAEDEPVTQIGSDFVDNLLEPGDIRTYHKSVVVPDSVKPGDYKVLIKLETSEYFTESNTVNNKQVIDKVLKIGTQVGSVGTTPVYSPATISSPGTYVIKRDITGNKGSDIITISTSGVTLDGGGYTIRGMPASGLTTGVAIKANEMLKGITIKNLNVDGVDTGVSFYNVNSGTVTNCNFTNTTNMGLRFDRSRDIKIEDNVFSGNSIGLGLFQSAGNTILNNYFRNTNNAIVNQEFKNRWSANITSGKNIVGGKNLGGNVWLKPDGQYSSAPTDSDLDGIADNPFAVDPDNIDYHPLIIPSDNSPTQSAMNKSESTDEKPSTLNSTNLVQGDNYSSVS